MLGGLAISHERVLVALILLVPIAGVTVWLVVRIVLAAKSRSVLGITCAVTPLFAYCSAQWILPGGNIIETVG